MRLILFFFNLEALSGNKKEGKDKESVWDFVPAPPASAAELPAMKNRVTNEEESLRNSSKIHKKMKTKKASSSLSEANKFVFVYDLALWLVLLIVAANIGFFAYKIILS